MTDDTLAASLAGPARVAGTATGRRCHTGHILDTVFAPLRAVILDQLHSTRDNGDDYVTDAELAKRLRDGGRPVSAAQLGRHRTRLCICDTFADDEQDNT